jgi:hypothetical protein
MPLVRVSVTPYGILGKSPDNKKNQDLKRMKKYILLIMLSIFILNIISLLSDKEKKLYLDNIYELTINDTLGRIYQTKDNKGSVVLTKMISCDTPYLIRAIGIQKRDFFINLAKTGDIVQKQAYSDTIFLFRGQEKTAFILQN